VSVAVYSFCFFFLPIAIIAGCLGSGATYCYFFICSFFGGYNYSTWFWGCSGSLV